MLKEIFVEIMESYPIESEKGFAGNSLADSIRHEFPELVQSFFPKYQDFIWDASPGKGRWADAPWLAIFNPLVTDTAQSGYYPVYLFTKSLNAVYLSLNQGMAELRDEFGDSQTKEILRTRAEILRSRLSPNYEKIFTSYSIDLEHSGPHSRLSFYEPAHVFGVKYAKEDFPPDEKIISDLNFMLDLYNLSIHKGGTDIDIELPIADQTQNEGSISEKKKFRVHLRAERNPKLAREAKRIHGYNCQVCGFNFEEIYGGLGHEFIEAHHLTPFSELPEDKVVNLSPQTDFSVVCSNCHSMLHRKGAPDQFEEFQEYYQKLARV